MRICDILTSSNAIESLLSQVLLTGIIFARFSCWVIAFFSEEGYKGVSHNKLWLLFESEVISKHETKSIYAYRTLSSYCNYRDSRGDSVPSFCSGKARS